MFRRTPSPAVHLRGPIKRSNSRIMVRITMEDGGIIDIQLDESAAPITCENFKKLVNQGFYNGLPCLLYTSDAADDIGPV